MPHSGSPKPVQRILSQKRSSRPKPQPRQATTATCCIPGRLCQTHAQKVHSRHDCSAPSTGSGGKPRLVAQVNQGSWIKTQNLPRTTMHVRCSEHARPAAGKPQLAAYRPPPAFPARYPATIPTASAHSPTLHDNGSSSELSHQAGRP